MDFKVNLHPDATYQHKKPQKTKKERNNYRNRLQHTRLSVIFAALVWKCKDDSRGITAFLAIPRTDII